MAPIATTTTSSLTSPPGPPAAKSQIAASNKDQSLSLDADGASTPYSSTSTAVSEKGEPSATSKLVVEENLPPTRLSPKDDHYFAHLIASSLPTPSSKPGSTVYGTAIEVVEALAVKHSAQVWVYDDASAVGFGSTAVSWAQEAVFGAETKVQAVQTRPGAGQEIAGYIKKTSGKVSVFASTATLPFLLPALETIEGDVVVNVATTAPDSSLVLADSLFTSGVLKSLTTLDWDIVFSSGSTIVDNAASIYGAAGKVVHVIEATHSGRETTSFAFPTPVATSTESYSSYNTSADNVYVVPAGHLAAVLASSLPSNQGLIVLNTLAPSSEELFTALSGKTVSIVGSKADAEALKAVILSTLYSASSSSTWILPTIKTVTTDDIAIASEPKETKTIAFYTAPIAPLPLLMAHLFLSSPSLATRLVQYGSSSTRGLKSILALSPSSAPTIPLSVNDSADVTWVSDANVLKSTDVLSSTKPGGILVLELPWTEEEVPVKLTRLELIAIKEKQLRVFLLDLNPAAPLNPIREQVAFLLLYTGKEKLSAGIRRVLDAFHSGHLGRDEVEDAQAGLIELDTDFEVPELEEGKAEKTKDAWEWDALPGQAGVIDLDEDAKPTLSGPALVAKHLFFREAFAADAKTTTLRPSTAGEATITALRPSTTDETFLVTVSENRRLTPHTYDRNVFHLELDSAGTGLKYEIGEAIGIHGWNDDAEVLEFCKWYGLDPDAVVNFPNPIVAGTMESRTVFQLLQQNVDLFGRPGKAFYAALAKLATSKADAMTLKFISAPEGAELFKRMAEKETVTFADVLYRFRTARPGIEELVGLIPEIKPRHYSIASSQKAIGDKVELLIVTVDWIDSKGSPRYGQCTRYLAALRPGDKVTVSIKPSVMKLPPDDRQPIIMAGLGTGAAPFRAFMQHRAWQRSQGTEVGPLIYYFGSRYRSQEYLYGEEIEAYLASGIISHAGLAFSRDGKDKVYIQHKMMQDKAMLSEMLLGEKERAAYFYLCGPTWPVPDVYEALVGSLSEEGGMERDAAERFIEELKEDERYVLEVYVSDV